MNLSALCRRYGVETGYWDLEGRWRRPSPDSLRKILKALGAPADRLKEGPKTVPTAFVDPASRRSWGLFVPLHALHSARSRGAGDFTDLAECARWVGKQGGRWLATLPLLPTFLDRPFDPSPYAPVSRLFWSEFWLDLTRVPEWRCSAAARRLAPPVGVRGRFVDYRGLMKRKRAALEAMSRLFFSGSGGRLAKFRRFLRENPRVEAYARFRADRERGDSSGYYAYAQWLAQEQMEDLVREARAHRVRLALDLPLGVHPDGYDAYAWRHLFAPGVSVGAPPDPFFSGGQNWGFAPLHPAKIRQDRYRYFADCLRHQMRVAGLLRIDHVMGLHRQFWIPQGASASEGTYVRYPARELYDVVCRESRRARCEVVGEDLGTVPPGVRSAMRRRRLHRMFVLQFEPGRAAPAESVASLNTHDMRPFAGFWKGRRPGLPAIRKALVALAAGPARIVMVTLEDLWGEWWPQNVPGTPSARNWRRRARYSMERLCRMKPVLETLREIECRRRC